MEFMHFSANEYGTLWKICGGIWCKENLAFAWVRSSPYLLMD